MQQVDAASGAYGRSMEGEAMASVEVHFHLRLVHSLHSLPLALRSPLQVSANMHKAKQMEKDAEGALNQLRMEVAKR